MNVGTTAGTIPAFDGEKIMQPIALKITEVCAASRIGRTRVYDAIKRGELRARKNGKSTLVLHADLVEWLSRLPAILPKTTHKK
jgi:excisionase family DNA binding protein